VELAEGQAREALFEALFEVLGFWRSV